MFNKNVLLWTKLIDYINYQLMILIRKYASKIVLIFPNKEYQPFWKDKTNNLTL